VAQQHFALPDDPRLQIFYDDAGHFVRRHPIEHEGYDVMLVDAFLDKGIAYSVCGSSFFAACRDLLTTEGVLSMNLWSDDRVHANDFIEDMGLSFAQQTLRLPVEGKANVIGIATRQATARKQLRGLDDRAKRLELHTAIEFTTLLHSLRKFNRRFF
jgi:spermidine synthase